MPFPINPLLSFSDMLPNSAFTNLIAKASVRMMWYKGHNCPCTGDTGSPNPQCNVCYGRGYYWDPAQGPFSLLVTLVTWIGRNVDMGEDIDANYGMAYEGHPIVTIPSTYNTLWNQANTNDIFVEIDAVERFNAVLRVNQQETVPAWHILNALTISSSGAVVVEDPTIVQPVSGVVYTVNGGTVTLNPTSQYPVWPSGTSYTVEYYSPPVFVVQERFGGLPHIRPFGSGVTYPRRFRVSLLDIWLRDNIGSSTNLG